MNIYIASDHGGFELKKQIVYFLTASVELSKELGTLSINDLGPEVLNENDDYPDYAFKVAEKVANDSESIGILLCRSGNGMVIAANKVKNVYAALCFNELHAKKAREDDGANVLCLDSDYKDTETHNKIIKSFLTSKRLTEDRFKRRLEKIQAFENQHFK